MFQLWITSEKKSSAESSFFPLTTSKYDGTSGHDYDRGEFTIGTFIK